MLLHSELLERYLNAVAEHLPAVHRADTLAELRANLESELEAREDALNRPLAEADVAAVLEAHGMPVLVAARYGPQQYLIGPQLFPFYWYTLKRSFPYVVALYALVQVVTAVTQAADGAQLGARIGAAVLHFPWVALLFWSIMTLGFAAFEFTQGRLIPKLSLPKWSVADLPRLEPKPPANLTTTHIVADLVVSVIVLAWLLMIPNRPYLIIGPGARVLNGEPFGITPQWHAFYWQIIALLAIMLPIKFMMVLPSLRRWRAHLNLAANAIGLGVLATMVTVRTFFVPGATITADKLGSLALLNTAINWGFEIALALSILKWLWDAFQLIRTSNQRTHRANFAAAK